MKMTPWSLKRPELRVKRVCRTCNNEWMSRLESDVKPHLQPLLAGQTHTISYAAQATLSWWVVKTAMALEGVDTPDTFCYTQEERNQLRLLGAIPWKTLVWLAPSIDATLFASSKVRHFESKYPSKLSGFSTTIGLAHIVLQVLTMRVPQDVGPKTKITIAVRRSPWTDTTLQVWPPANSATRWPTKMALNGEGGIDEFANRFDMKGLAESDTEVLVV